VTTTIPIQHFNKPIIVAYPRSGTNYVCQMLKLVTNKAYDDVEKEEDFWIRRTHDVRGTDKIGRPTIEPLFNIDGSYRYNKIILLLRDFYDGYIRTNKKLTYGKNEPLKARLNATALESYFVNLRAYDNYPNCKLLLYYEDFIGRFEQLYPLFKFLNLENYENITKQQIQDAEFCSRRTYNMKQKHKYHIAKYDNAEREWLCDYVECKYPKLFEKYLQRYVQ